jgi:intraflagellar transport protein 122
MHDPPRAQHLVSEEKVRIKCRDYIKKIAVYRDKIAVQLPDRVLIYQLNAPKDDADMHYVALAKIQRAFDCNLLVVTSSQFILCLESRLQLCPPPPPPPLPPPPPPSTRTLSHALPTRYDFAGNREREWILDSVIRYIKVVGGASGREGLLVGLKDGQILKIFVDNPFPQLLLKHTSCIRCLDLSMSRRLQASARDFFYCGVSLLFRYLTVFQSCARVTQRHSLDT